jgi:hypothetical protein
VLINASNYVRGKMLPSIFTFDKDLVKGWLLAAKVSSSGCGCGCGSGSDSGW